MASIPDKVGKYKILSLLGSGGTSIVYLGLHPTLKRKVVLKKLNLRGKKSFYDRFLQEAALMMDLNHDHIVKVYDHFKEGSRHYMVMEFVEGLSLDQIIEHSGPLNHETIRYILRCCCKALDYIHSRNIIHRDIKPSNIFISKSGDVKLGDFGIALLDDPSDREVSSGSALVGTPSYMAPEQFSPRGQVTARTDLYALGVSYFELLTGEKMFSGESLEELREAIRKGRHLSLLFLIRSYSFSCWHFIKKSTRHYPVFRYSSAKRALQSLSSFRMNDENSIHDLSGRIESLNPNVKSKAGPAQAGRNLGFSQVLKAAPPPVQGRTSWYFLFAVLTLILTLGLLFHSGSFYKWFLPQQYGSLSFVLNEGVGETLPLDDLQVFLQHGESRNSWKTIQIDSSEKLLFRRSGFYTMKSIWGNRVVSRSFYLPPLAAGSDPYRIVLQSPAAHLQKLDLNIVLSDVFSGQLIPERTGVFLQKDDGSRIPMNSKTEFYAGTRYNISIKIPGYYEALYTVSSEFYQDEYLLDASLIPYPGELEVHHNLEKLVLLVDHKKTIQGVRGYGRRQHFGKLELESDVWKIPPGVHLLSWSGRGWKQDQKLTVRSGEKVVFRVTMDSKGTAQFSIDRKTLEKH